MHSTARNILPTTNQPDLPFVAPVCQIPEAFFGQLTFNQSAKC
ncbi:hypothetical protein BN2497_3195 [Janthinobacterium sp. CG23_2]|nr:hypothetical protein BN2497_3195 [Janthinobacterium sp. CG23_2]CUU27995.1 hypothetical protein BN3177_3195 [Janthinobacterium sp. CG23_2]